jgi:membrane-anchored protein YejM (alkaline phosphatase superfamily)
MEATGTSGQPLGDDAAREARRSRRRVLLGVWLANLAIGLAIAAAYLDYVPVAASTRAWWFAHLGLVSSLATLTALPLVLTWLLSTAVRREGLLVTGAALAWSAFHLTLYIDTRIFRLFRYHLNGSAWNLLTTRGSEDSFHLGWQIWVKGSLLFLALCGLQVLLWRVVRVLEEREVKPLDLPRRLLRPTVLVPSLIALSIGVEKTIYAGADLTVDREVAAVSQIFPMYTRLRVSPLLPPELTEILGEGAEQPPPFALRLPGARLGYPHARPAVDPAAPKPNVLIVVVDSWRADRLDPETTPNLWRFAGGARRFDDHLSGGNGTRFGVFSMLYGLHGSYWWPVLDAGRPPVLIESLGALGYERRVFASASQDYPEFRQTAWNDAGVVVDDDFPEERSSERDASLVDRFLAWRETAAEGAPAPWFSFVLLDSAHQTYDFPEEDRLFEPCSDELDYLEMAASPTRELALSISNRYRNALHYTDRCAGRLLDGLAQLGELDDTIVVITGDHGEEFAEHGHWGHTNNFTRAQTAVPLILRGPGIAAGVETAPTSHLDLPGTLLGLLGADLSDSASWTQGRDLLDAADADDDRARSVAGWAELGLVTDDGTFRIPMTSHGGFEICAMDDAWRMLVDQALPFERRRDDLLRLAEECTRFLDLPPQP